MFIAINKVRGTDMSPRVGLWVLRCWIFSTKMPALPDLKNDDLRLRPCMDFSYGKTEIR